MKYLIRKVLIIGILLVTVPLFGRDISNTFMVEYQSGDFIYIGKKSSQLRSKASFSAKRTSRDGKIIYIISQHGKGDYDNYSNVTWDATAEAEEKDGFLYPISNVRIIKNEEANIIIKYEINFDYEKRKIYYSSWRSEGNMKKNMTFPIKGKTVDSTTMAYFLKTFIAHRNEREYRAFYLLSDKGELYRITIRNMPSEELELPMGKVKAIKIQIIPNLGLLSGLAGAIVPPTFLWYSENSPYILLKYEGLETGIGSPHVISYLSKVTLPISE